MTPYRIAVVDDLERDRAWLAEKLADYMARERLEYELMNKKHMSYQEAHRLAEKKYNYQKALKEFKNKNNL